MPYPTWFLQRMLFAAIGQADADKVRNWLAEGADPNGTTPAGTPLLIRAVREHTVEFDIVKALLDAGADHTVSDRHALTALDHARRRLLKFEGKPRRQPRPSRSLTPGGELRLPEREWQHIRVTEAQHPGYEEMYLEERRKAAERVFDTRGNLERIIPLLESIQRR
jgi:hypothetical protein